MGKNSTNNIFRKLNKSTLLRFKELYFSGQIINDSLSLYEQGKHYQLNVICGQFRSILFEKSKGNEPLLFEILNLIDKKPSIYASKSNKREKPAKLFTINNLSLYEINSSIKPFENCFQYGLEDFIKIEAIKYYKIKISISKLLMDYSNNFGGSHYSQKVPNYIVQFQNIFLNNKNLLDFAISNYVKTLFDFTYEVIRSTIEIDYYLNLILFDKNTNSGNIIDYRLINNPNGFSISHNSNDDTLNVIITDSLGIKKELNFDVTNFLNNELLFNLEIKVDDSFNTNINLYLNNKKVKTIKEKKPFIFLNELHNHEMYINKQQENIADYSFKIGDFFYYNEINHIGKKSDILHYCKQNVSFRLLNKNDYGYKKAGDSKLYFKTSLNPQDE